MATIEEFLKRDIAHKGDFLVTSTGDLDTISGLENVQNALFHRLITSPGSLIHRPNYGVGIKDFQNSINDIENQRRLALRIQEQYELDPRVEEVLGVRVDVGDLTPEKIIVTVRYNVLGYGEVTSRFIPFGEGV